jgi:hypothetical protein
MSGKVGLLDGIYMTGLKHVTENKFHRSTNLKKHDVKDEPIKNDDLCDNVEDKHSKNDNLGVKNEFKDFSEPMSRVRKSKYKHYLVSPDHPLHKTHHTKECSDDDDMIVNFIGASLPRCDQGDREYYCLTMLALFKPWRTGGELKSETENWDTAFTNYKFTTEKLKLMRNFNIRYKCLDARDDHHAQLQKSAGILPVWDENLSATCDGADLDNMYTAQPDIENDEIPLEFFQLGEAVAKRLHETMKMRNIMTNLG